MEVPNATDGRRGTWLFAIGASAVLLVGLWWFFVGRTPTIDPEFLAEIQPLADEAVRIASHSTRINELWDEEWDPLPNPERAERFQEVRGELGSIQAQIESLGTRVGDLEPVDEAASRLKADAQDWIAEMASAADLMFIGFVDDPPGVKDRRWQGRDDLREAAIALAAEVERLGGSSVDADVLASPLFL